MICLNNSTSRRCLLSYVGIILLEGLIEGVGQDIIAFCDDRLLSSSKYDDLTYGNIEDILKRNV